MKKIAIVSTMEGVPWGGSELLWYSTLQYFKNCEVEIMICVKEWEPMPNQIQQISNQVKVVLRKRNNNLVRFFKKILPKNVNFANYDTYKDEILKWKPSIVLVSQGGNFDGVEIMLFFLNNSIRYLSLSHAAFEGWWPNENLSEKMNKAFSGAVHNFFVSNANRNLTELQIGQRLSNCSVVRNPINVPYNNNLDYPKEKTLKLACVARYDFDAKGQDLLLQVMSKEKWKNRDLIINFYGSGKHEYSINKLINFYNLTNVYLRGYSETIDIWANNHALILPSRYEGLPISLVEAMICGRFGIVTDVSGNSEVIINGVNGFLSQAPSVDSIDTAMELAWKEKENWREIGERAKEHIRNIIPENPGYIFFLSLMEIL